MRNIKKYTFIHFLLFLFCINFLGAQITRKYSNEFLNIGADARAFGMGNNVVANTSDVNSVYWNPAGLTQVYDDWQGALMHAEYFQSVAKYEYAAAAIPLENQGTIGFSLYRFAVDDILNTTQLIDNQGNIDYNKISTFSTADYAGIISYAGNFFNDPKLSIGANAKIVYRHIGKFANSFGFGLDLGLQYRTEDNFYFGAMARDITTTFNVWSINEKELHKVTVDSITLNEMPEEKTELTLPKLKLGVAKLFQINEKIGVLTEANLNFDFAQTNSLVTSNSLSMSPSLGFELDYDKTVFVRGGINNVQYDENFNGDKKITLQPNIGVGFRYKGVTVDYALTNVGNASVALYSNIFSVKIDMSQFYR